MREERACTWGNGLEAISTIRLYPIVVPLRPNVAVTDSWCGQAPEPSSDLSMTDILLEVDRPIVRATKTSRGDWYALPDQLEINRPISAGV